MRGVFGILLIGGGIVLMYGLFTGKINFPGGTPSLGTGNILSSVATSTGVYPALPGQGCPPGSNIVAGACRPNPHNCKPGQVWFQNQCVDVVA